MNKYNLTQRNIYAYLYRIFFFKCFIQNFIEISTSRTTVLKHYLRVFFSLEKINYLFTWRYWKHWKL